MERSKLKFKDESGVTLVELLAALAILALIVTAFLAFFIQSARTTSRSSDVNEATFLAQQEMEEMVYYSSNKTLKEAIDDRGFSEGMKTSYDSPYTVKTRFEEIQDSDLYAVIVEVFEGDTTETTARRAIMENRLPFDGTD